MTANRKTERSSYEKKGTEHSTTLQSTTNPSGKFGGHLSIFEPRGIGEEKGN